MPRPFRDLPIAGTPTVIVWAKRRGTVDFDRGHDRFAGRGARRLTYPSCTNRVRPVYDGVVSVPVTARLDEAVVEALDRAVAAGLASNRGSLVANAVREWLDRHGEEAIAASYRRRYAQRDAEQDALVAALSSFSVAACLANVER